MTLQPRLQVRTCGTRQCPLTSEKKKKKYIWNRVRVHSWTRKAESMDWPLQ